MLGTVSFGKELSFKKAAVSTQSLSGGWSGIGLVLIQAAYTQSLLWNMCCPSNLTPFKKGMSFLPNFKENLLSS